MPETILIILVVLVLFVLAFMIFRTTVYGKAPESVEPAELKSVDTGQVAEHLAAAIRLQTISDLDRSKINYTTFDLLHSALERMYPQVHAELKREWVSRYTLLYTWPGRAPELEPVLFCAHQDVVPVDPSTRGDWTVSPFNGTIDAGFVWGRGALDIKSSLITLLDAVEGLLKAGYQPERTIYLAFGHDEEIGGLEGAKCVVELLTQRGIRLAAVLDEGGAIMVDGVPGVTLPVAVIGIAEKGHISVELSVEGRGGHSSTPPPHTSIGVLSRAITRVEAHPMPMRTSMSRLMFESLGPFLPFGMRFLLANGWLFNGTITKRLAANSTMNAMIRTSQAVTMIQGGVKDNILPAQARAVVNCRILPGDRSDKVVDHLRRAIDDEAIMIKASDEATWEPSPVSSIESGPFRDLSKAIRQVFPEAIVAPYLVLGATDSRYYAPICSHVFRFSPYFLNSELLNTIHGTDERISIEGLGRMVQFYMQIMQVWTGK